MKQIFTLVLITLLGNYLSAQTEVSGNQSGSWIAADSPYLVIGEILVPSGETLIVEAGVEVNFQAHYKFIVNGTIQVMGIATDSVVFTTDDPDIGWGGIRIDGTDNHVFNYCRIEYGKTQGEYPDNHGGGMALMGSNVAFSHCTFAHNDATGEDNGMGGAIYAFGLSTTTFVNCLFYQNHAYGEGGAIEFSSDYGTTFYDCQFIQNDCNYGGGAVACYLVEGTTFTNTLFAENYTMYSNGGAVQISGMGNNAYFENTTMSENTAVTGDGGAMNVAYGTAYMTNCIVYQNDGMYSDDVNLDMAGNAEINYCNMTIPDGAIGGNNISIDPQFVNAEILDFHLQESSPCIDAGTDLGYPYWGDAPDMGCFEYEDPDGVSSENSINYSIYPNPTKDLLFVKGDMIDMDIQLLDISGKSLSTSLIDNNRIDLSHLQSGVYFIVIKDNYHETVRLRAIKN
ncbi:MAG: hypothetical protein B7C24_02290 [Bacteroidetes bacterium 4572_77]|nr:MAG: hypothetical protein B7C24_02290 [Bacteroidetes bacterium 4572_77]